MEELPIRTQQDRSIVRHGGMGGVPGMPLPFEDKSAFQDDFKAYLRILKRRKWWIVIPFMIILPLVMVQLSSEKPIYVAKTTLLIENDTPQILDIQKLINSDGSPNFYLTEYEMIKSLENIEEVVDTLQLDQKIVDEPKNFIAEQIDMVKSTLKDTIAKAIDFIKSQWQVDTESNENDRMAPILDPNELRRQAAIDTFSGALVVFPREGGKLVDISVSGDDPRDVAQQANTLAEVYTRRNQEKRSEASRKAVVWLNEQTAELRKKMQDAELELQRFREQKSIVSLDVQGNNNIVLSRLSQLQQSYAEANASRINLETTLENIRQFSERGLDEMEIIPPFLGDRMAEQIVNARSKYLDLKIRYADLSQKYTQNHPIMIQLKSQMEEARSIVARELRYAMDTTRQEYAIVRSREASLEKELLDQKGRALTLNNDLISYNALKDDADSYRTLYHDAAKRLREIQLTQASVPNNVSIVQRAAIPLEPISSKRTMKLLLGVALSGCLGVGLAFLRDYFDHRFTEAEQVESYLRLPFLGTIPHFKSGRRKVYDPLSWHEAASATSESYRLLRTRIQSFSPVLKTLFVTSAVPSEGKSTTTANLGISFAQLGQKVLLVDTDFRRPTLNRHFRVSKDKGLTDILLNGATLEQVVHETPLPHLKILATGKVLHNPSDILNLPAMKQFIQQAAETFDLVIFDSPVILSIPDAEILAPEMDAVLLVHAPGRCPKETVLGARRILDKIGARVLGIVFNNVRKKDEKYYSYYQQYYGRYQYRSATAYQYLPPMHHPPDHPYNPIIDNPPPDEFRRPMNNDTYLDINHYPKS